MWAPLPGFMYGPLSLICARSTGPQVSAVTLVLLIPRSQSRGGGGRGARGLGYYPEFSN